MSKTAFLLGTIITIATSSARAQVYYEPVRYQCGVNPAFYYGGINPAVFEYANRTVYSDGIAGPRTSDRYHVGTTYRGSMNSIPPAVFSDQLPYVNAALFHYTPADARNEANATIPTYFRKADLLRAAVPSLDGQTWVVPPQAPLLVAAAGEITIRPWQGRPAAQAPASRPAPAAPATKPADAPAPILIIPIPPKEQIVATAR